MFELSDDPVQPTLSDRLREAAVRRAEIRGDVVDDVVLDPDGVLDLRTPSPGRPGAATEPAAAIATTRGGFDGLDDVAELYDQDEPGRAWWQRGRDDEEARRADRAPGSETSPTLSAVPLTDEMQATPKPSTPDIPDAGSATVTDDGETIIIESPSTPEAEIDLTDSADDESRPTGSCPSCGGVGRRDLFDRVSQTDYYSCDVCAAMWQEPHS